MNKQKHLAVEVVGELPALAPGDVTAVLIFRSGDNVSHLDDELRRAVEALLASGEFEAKEDSTLLLHAASVEGSRRLLLVGLGEPGTDDSSLFRRAAAVAIRRAKDAGARRLVLVKPASHPDGAILSAIAEGAFLGSYESDFYKEAEDDDPSLERLVIVDRPDGGHDAADLVDRARIVAESVNWARELADEPGNILPPREFARRAAEMAEEFGLAVESLDGSEIRERGMGGLLGVGQGSDNEPALIVVRYTPEELTTTADDSAELWAFVGKGITFDTGGISLKKPLGMEEMKSDMAGGAAVLAALRAIAQLKPRKRVVAIVPTAENMPSGRAIKPGDIVRTLAGHTIEVVDTDAEGRLVLVDGIAFAKQLGATSIVDVATLTGAIIVALGTHRTGLFSNDDAWATAVQAAAERAGEPVWRMPVSDDYKNKIESPIADFKNYGGKPDAVAAALLLSKFAGDTPWVHLDIAGTSWHDEATSYAPKGASGAGVRTLIELVVG